MGELDGSTFSGWAGAVARVLGTSAPSPAQEGDGQLTRPGGAKRVSALRTHRA